MSEKEKNSKYSYERFDSQGVRVGQAVLDILSIPQPEMTAEEVIEGMAHGIVNYIQEIAEEGYKQFEKDFYIIHIFRKILGYLDVKNVMSQKAIGFVSGPIDPKFYMKEIPSATKTLYSVDRKNGIIKLNWTVPGWEDCKSILKNPSIYDFKLVEWVKEATHGLKCEQGV